MRWARTLLCTWTHKSVKFQTDCISLSTEKSYCRNRGLIWQITFSPSISHLMCNVRIFFIEEEFPFIGSKCENHSYCPRIESKSAWLQHNLHFHVSHFCISTKLAARITNWRQWGWVSPWKSTEQLFSCHACPHLPAQSTAQTPLPTQGLQKTSP